MPKEFTKQGFEKLKKELDYLQNVRQKEITKELKHAAGFGDFSENAAYDQAKEAQAFLRGRVLQLKKMLANAKIIEKKSSSRVELGSIVDISTDNQKPETIQIVNSAESNPMQGKISLDSPLGAQLYHKKTGDEVKVVAPDGETVYKILKIR